MIHTAHPAQKNRMNLYSISENMQNSPMANTNHTRMANYNMIHTLTHENMKYMNIQFLKYTKFLLLGLLLLAGAQEGMGQTIPATNTVIVGEGAIPTGWTQVSPSPDVSNNLAWQGRSTEPIFPWVGTVSNPPNGHTVWISGTSNTGINEASGTTITGLIPGKNYKLVFHMAELRISSSAPAVYDGVLQIRAGKAAGFNGTLLQEYNFTGGNSNAWSTQEFIFTAAATTFDLSFGVPLVASGIQNNIFNLSISADAVKEVCVAGTAAPNLSASTLTNPCTKTSVDLTTITASNTPANTILTWHTATPATNANKIPTADLTSRPAGTYHAAFFDAAFSNGGCYSGGGAATTPVVVTVVDCCTITPAPVFDNN